MIPPDAHPQEIATADEVLATFTALMRGDKSSEQLKAAEQLAKYHSLFAPREEAAIRPEIIAEVEAAVRQLQMTVQASGATGAPGADEVPWDTEANAAPDKGGP